MNYLLLLSLLIDTVEISQRIFTPSFFLYRNLTALPNEFHISFPFHQRISPSPCRMQIAMKLFAWRLLKPKFRPPKPIHKTIQVNFIFDC